MKCAEEAPSFFWIVSTIFLYNFISAILAGAVFFLQLPSWQRGRAVSSVSQAVCIYTVLRAALAAPKLEIP